MRSLLSEVAQMIKQYKCIAKTCMRIIIVSFFITKVTQVSNEKNPLTTDQDMLVHTCSIYVSEKSGNEIFE